MKLNIFPILGKAYSAAMGATMSKLLADEIKEKVQFLNIPRYRKTSVTCSPILHSSK